MLLFSIPPISFLCMFLFFFSSWSTHITLSACRSRSLSVMSSRLIRVVACVRTRFLFVAKQHPTELQFVFAFSSVVSGHLSVSMSYCEQCCSGRVWTSFCFHTCSVLSSICQGLELLGHDNPVCNCVRTRQSFHGCCVCVQGPSSMPLPALGLSY